MHYKGHIITKKIPTDEQISKILEKYRYDDEEEKDFEWDWYMIGGRYGGQIKIKFNPKENEDNYFGFRNRNYKYFISHILSEEKEKNKYYEELYCLLYMGLNENILYVDGGYYNNTINFDITNCFLVIDDEENLYVREIWKDETFITDNEFDNKVKNIDLKDKFITVIDFHD